MATDVLVLLATNKGAFIMEASDDRTSFHIRGPYCDGWPIHHIVADPRTGTLYAAGGNPWTGLGVWVSTDHGLTWDRKGEGFDYGENGPKMKAVWSLAIAHGRIYAGVEPAGLFVSDDGAETFHHVSALREHPSAADWVPGGGGLILHSIVADPQDANCLWVGISTGGVYVTEDGGRTWAPRNKGTRCDFGFGEPTYPDHGQCVHSVVRAPGRGQRLYQQNHCGMYVSDDGGSGWRSIEAGLPTSFGFPTAVHPRDPDTLWYIPMAGQSERYMPDGRAAVWRSDDAGRTWKDLRVGLPQENAYLCVLRQAFATDTKPIVGLYFATNSGAVFVSRNAGDSWTCAALHLPMIQAVETLTLT